ncbi:helix-turn-helix transcriptional regulator [Rhodococcus aetherivorans]|uniref:helix-turn-helix transcriptional regulator n=1 Tax=Rhodococcus aetherivorans TaxID=191292 RepID=UPI003EB94A49
MSEEIGTRIRTLRKSRGWSAQELADRVTSTGVSLGRTKVSELETGRSSDIRLSVAKAIAGIFGMSVDQLADFDTPTSAYVIAEEIAAAKEKLAKEFWP